MTTAELAIKARAEIPDEGSISGTAVNAAHKELGFTIISNVAAAKTVHAKPIILGICSPSGLSQ
jgi:phosphoribosylformylglycinamidine (FGAM) synthase PurS component